jgi:hypothetical protein
MFCVKDDARSEWFAEKSWLHLERYGGHVGGQIASWFSLAAVMGHTQILRCTHYYRGYAVAKRVEALPYKPEGNGFDS